MTVDSAADRRERDRQQRAKNARQLGEYGDGALGMPTKTLRIPDALWDDALDAARMNDETVSAVIRAALVRYVKATRRRHGLS